MERLRRPAAVRGLRIAAVSALVVVVVAGGAVALWLSTRQSEPTPAAEVKRPSVDPPIRLDSLPAPRSPERSRRSERATAATEDEERGSGTDDASDEQDGDRSNEEEPSEADIRRAIAALAGENAAIQAALSGDRKPGSGTGEIVRPARGPVAVRFGRSFGRLHAGIDIEVPAGTPVHAADSGRVAISGVEGAYGKFICIQHTGSLSTCYAHNSRLMASEGESVDSGEVISESGCSGRCYGDHLHFEVRVRGKAVNPRDYL